MQGAEKVRRSWKEKSVGRLTYFSPPNEKGGKKRGEIVKEEE